MLATATVTLVACASRGSPPCDDLQMNAHTTACPPTDASAELVDVIGIHLDGADDRTAPEAQGAEGGGPSDAAPADAVSPF